MFLRNVGDLRSTRYYVSEDNRKNLKSDFWWGSETVWFSHRHERIETCKSTTGKQIKTKEQPQTQHTNELLQEYVEYKRHKF
jgi:hypothetical protein